VSQLIGIKSVPLATGDQFLVHPSRNLGMGGVSIAIDDPLLDPFVNPAKGSRMRESRFYGSPVFYNVSGGDGAGRTLPVGALFASRTWFGGVQLSLQQIEAADRGDGFIFLDQPVFPGSTFEPLRDRAANNMYAFGLVGRRVPGTRMSLGASVFYADLEALDGVDLLYTMSESLEQSGHVADVRLGLTGEIESGGTFEAVLVHHRMDMTHEITNVQWPCCWGPEPWIPVRQVETNFDRTNTWGLHLGHRRPIGEHGWSAGGIITANRKTHPKIPNYEIMNIPRDPGDSWAWNFGVGLSRALGPTRFAVDVIWEPIWSNTWADADSTLQSPLGHQIRKGEKTVENDFSFSNAIVRAGLLRETARWGASLGLEVRSYGFDLEQTDNVLRTQRDQKESWMEWTPSWGGSVRFSEIELRYNGRLTTGSGRPGVTWSAARLDQLTTMADFIIAPSGPLTLQDAHIFTHQLSVSLPIR
jgi:hypothetical protein